MSSGGRHAEPPAAPCPHGPLPGPAPRLETVLRHSSDVVVLCDASGRVVDCNQAALDAVRPSTSDPQVSGRVLADVVPAELRAGVAAAWQRLLAGAELATATASVGGRQVRVHLGAIVHHELLEGVVVLWRPPGAPRHAPPSLGPAEDLRRGIEADELRLHYQPIVELTDARPVATEALVRWQHPDRGLLAPDAFIELAERTGLVVDLGDWVLREACTTAARWAARGPESGALSVTVNLSPRQLHDSAVVDTLRSSLEDTGCPPERVVLEVTETAVMADLSAAVHTLSELKDLGVGLAIDDFGTGYSSLLYLKHFPVDSIKIDRSFVAGLGRDPDDTAIVAATVSLAHSVDVRCVAEGVETVEHLDLLREMGCDYAQGFLFSRPLEPAALRDWFSAHRPADRELVGRPREAALPTAVVDLLAEGASLHTIAAALNAQGSRTERGTRWSARSVAHLVATSRPARTPS